MKAGILAGGLLLVAMAPSVSASTATCENVKAKYVSANGKVYKFAGTIKCSVNASVETNSVRDAMRSSLENGGTFNNETDGFTRAGMSGSQFEYKENTAHTAHGDITVTYDGSFVSNDYTVSYLADSKNVDADGDAARTEGVKVEITYTNTNGVVSATVTKTVDVRKPTLAPSGMFQSRVLDSLRTEIQASGEIQKSVLNGL